MPRDRADVRSLFESVIPYFESGEKPSEEILKLKMVEGVYMLLHTDSSLYASLFDFVEPWKIDILDYLNFAFTPITGDITGEIDLYFKDLTMKGA